MEFKFNNLTDLLLTFNTEEKCAAYLEQQRWHGKITCPHCGYDKKIWRIKTGFKCASPTCDKKFTVKVGTFFESSNVKLQKWFCAIYLFTAHKKGISSCQLARDIGVTQGTAWFMLHRIRKMFTVKESKKMSGNIQVDETYMGGKTKNKHEWQRDIIHAAGSSAVHMNPVFGMANKGLVKIIPVSQADKATLQPIIKAMVRKGATVVSDGHGSYVGLDEIYKHYILNHEAGEYVKGGRHTNQIENFWSQMKRGIYGIYHHASGKHLAAYCDEFAYRYNTREIEDNHRFNISLTKTKGRLKYKQLIA